jgi:hypothetical protein
MFSSSSFREESIERIVTTSDGLVTWHLTIRLDAVLQAEELPASVTNLNASLADVDAKSLTRGCKEDKSYEESEEASFWLK